MSEKQFDFGAMVSAQMKTFRPGFKFPQSFNDLQSVEADPEKRKAAIKVFLVNFVAGGAVNTYFHRKLRYS